MEACADIGIVGTGVMGASIARNLARHGYRVAIYDIDTAKAQSLVSRYSQEGVLLCAPGIESFAQMLHKARVALLLVPAGGPTENAISSLLEVFEPGDIIVDMGNSLFSDTRRREAMVAKTGIHFVGCGTSGGQQGALYGPSLMPGGSKESYERLGPMLEAISAKYEGEDCCVHVGPDGAGHYVKMVHNGIEYADMQLISEAYQLMRYGLGIAPGEIGKIFAQWNEGELSSYLIEITADLLGHVDGETGAPFIDIIDDVAGQKGTGAWTVQNALDLAISDSVIAEAAFARGTSDSANTRQEARAVLGENPARKLLGVDQEDFVEDIRKALYASKIIAYAQGFIQMRRASREYHWDLKLGEMARIWRAGCIIRAQFLDRITQAYDRNENLTFLGADDFFAHVLLDAQDAWRRVVAAGASNAIALPAFSSALAYYDSIRTQRLSTALVQAQRDYFGSHTYHRVDKPGVFHTLWENQARPEVQM